MRQVMYAVTILVAVLCSAAFTGCGGLKTAAAVTPTRSPVAKGTTEDDMPLPARADKVVEPCKVLPADFKESPIVEFYGNFETAGVILEMPAAIPTDKVGNVCLFLNVNGQWDRVHDMARSGATRSWLGSIFWLKPESAYQVKVVVYDRSTGQPLATECKSGQTRKEPVLPDSPKRLYVATTGNDANSGTLERPLRTLGKAFAIVQPGTTIFARSGVYYEGDLQFERSGEPGAPIVVRSYGNEKVALDGSNPALMEASAWKDEGGNIYSCAYQGKSYNMILENRKTGQMIRALPLRTVGEVRKRAFDLARLGSDFAKEAPQLDKNGVDAAFATDGTTAVAALPGPISDYIVHIARSTKGIILENRNNIMLDGLEIRFFGKEDYSAGAFVFNSSDILFQNCTFTFDDTQIWVKANSHRLTVQDCSFIDALTNYPFAILKNDGALCSYEAGAINVDGTYSGRGMVIRRNRIQNLFDGVHLTPWIVDEARSQETDFYHNRILGCLDDFMELDGFSRNVRVFENYMRRSLSGVSVAQALDGPTFVIYNVLADCGLTASTTREGNWSYPFKTNGGPGAETVGSGPMFFYHNTAYTTDPQSHAMLVKRPIWIHLTLKNNIWIGQKLGFEIWRSQPSPMDWDYDDLYTFNPKGSLMYIDYGKGGDLKSIREIDAKYPGFMKNGINADPMIKDQWVGDYMLKDASPCIDAGVVIPGINSMRKLGKAPDLGAYEMR